MHNMIYKLNRVSMNLQKLDLRIIKDQFKTFSKLMEIFTNMSHVIVCSDHVTHCAYVELIVHASIITRLCLACMYHMIM